MERASWIVDGSWIARNIKNASSSSSSSTLEIKDSEAYINCPSCSYRIDNSSVKNNLQIKHVLTPTWPGLPKGVKFDPTDEEVIEHLEAKCGIDGLNPHLLVHDFICSLTDDLGINYTHPQNLPGVKKDGISVFFFNKTAQAYPKGQRKRRKINGESVRWHKTGKTKAVMINGLQKGSKKIMVLYKSTRKGLQPEKTNWVLHQYSLGTKEGEIGEYVVSKITYQEKKQWEKTVDESESCRVGGGPRRPKASTSTQPRPEIVVDEDELTYHDTNMVLDSFLQKPKYENIDIGFGEFSDLEDPEIETLPDLLSFASEYSFLNWFDGIETPKQESYNLRLTQSLNHLEPISFNHYELENPKHIMVEVYWQQRVRINLHLFHTCRRWESNKMFL